MKKFTFSTSDNGYTLILGLGETGLAAAHWYLQQLLPVRLADTRPAVQTQVETLLQQYELTQLEVVLGPAALDLSVLDGIQTVVISPGLAISDSAVAALLQAARQQNITVMSEVELFAQALADLATQGYHPKVLAVTGTNGKTTVVQLVKHMLLSAQYQVQVAGNISPAALTALSQALARQQLPDIWVIELSSFQLEHTFNLPVLAGVVLNISQDHIDWHGSMAAYAQAKARLLTMSQIAVVNRDDSQSLEMVAGATVWRSFGLDTPKRRYDFGIDFYQEQNWLCQALAAPHNLEHWLPTSALPIPGRHNQSNALAALCLVDAAGIDLEPALEALSSYYGEPHRCQFVRSVRGVSFINDSKGTNVGATVAAIQGLGRSLVLIAGGVAKGQDFTPLAHALQHSACRAVLLIGRDAALIQSALSKLTQPVELVGTLPEAVQRAYALSLEGDVVLLSPACASLDMFSNYIERGYQFVDAVTELALDQGEVA